MLSLTQAREGFLLTKRVEGLSERTLSQYKRQIGMLADFLEDPPVDTVSTTDLRRFFDYLRNDYTPQRLTGNTQPLSAQTTRNYWVALSSFYTWATAEFGVEDAMQPIPAPKTSPATITPIKPQEVRDMLDACMRTSDGRARPNRYRNRAILMALCDTGIRNSELRALKIRDYHREKRRIDIHHGKGGKNRVVFASERTAKAIWRYLVERDDRYDPDAPLFATQTGEHLSRSWLRKLLVQIGREAGVEDMTVHATRHFFATQYLKNNGDIFTLRRALGHSSLEMVKRYAAIADVDLQRVHRQASPISNL